MKDDGPRFYDIDMRSSAPGILCDHLWWWEIFHRVPVILHDLIGAFKPRVLVRHALEACWYSLQIMHEYTDKAMVAADGGAGGGDSTVKKLKWARSANRCRIWTQNKLNFSMLVLRIWKFCRVAFPTYRHATFSIFCSVFLQPCCRPSCLLGTNEGLKLKLIYVLVLIVYRLIYLPALICLSFLWSFIRA